MAAPCVTDVASARYESDADWDSYAGYALTVAGEHLVVGAPFLYDGFNSGVSQALSLSLPELQWEGAWVGKQYDFFTGGALDAADIDGDGTPEVAISELSALSGDDGGKVHIVSSAVDGEVPVESVALLTLIGNDGTLLGHRIFFSSEATEIVVNGASKKATDGRVLAFSTSERDTAHESEALRVITAPGPLGTIARWDGDSDGQDDLVIQHYWGSVAWFQGPWSSGTIEDADLYWTNPCTGCDFGQVMREVGDVTGDGAPDLGLSAPQHNEPREWAGRVYVLESAGAGGDAEDTPLQVHGAQEYDGMGFELAGADLDGDGQQDLVVSASGDQPGSLLVFRGPLSPAHLVVEDADAVVRGQYEGDLFVRSIAVLDADHDGRDDLAVGAPGWPAGYGMGAVYLLAGAALLP